MIYIGFSSCRFAVSEYDSKSVIFLFNLFDSRINEAINKIEVNWCMSGNNLILHFTPNIIMHNESVHYYPNLSKLFASDFFDILHYSILFPANTVENLEYYMGFV